MSEDIDRLRDQFLVRAEREGLIDVALEEAESPWGRLWIAATHKGVVRVGLPVLSESEVLEELAAKVSPRVLKHPRGHIAQAKSELEEYFQGKRRSFQTPLDWSLTGGFRLDALQVVRDIPYGSVATYSMIAQGAGRAKAVRACATACATNPIPLIVPCHRVIRRDGSLGGYLGGLQMKEELLCLEGGREKSFLDTG